MAECRSKKFAGWCEISLTYVKYHLTTWNIAYQLEKSDVAVAWSIAEKGVLDKEEAMVIVCYSTGSREIRGYIPLFFGRAAK